MINRISKFIEHQGISIRAFEQKISASNGLIRKAIANNTDIQSKWITAIVDNYPQINPIWLIKGEGPMLKSSSQDNNKTEFNSENHRLEDVLISIIKTKDDKIEELSEEVGKLKAQKESLEQTIEKIRDSEDAKADVEDATIVECATATAD